MRLFFLLALLTPVALKAQSAPPDLGTVLWLQTLRAHPEMSSPGLQVASNPVQERYNQLLQRSLKSNAKASGDQTTGLSAPLSAPVETPVLDSASIPSAQAPSPSSKPSIAPRRITGSSKLTPYQLCLRDGGCEGLR